MRRSSPYPVALSTALAAVVLLGGAGCFNDAFRGRETHVEGGLNRFELVIEPDRTGVEGTHFLVDRATGDLWRLDVSNRSAGTWVRLATGPEDVAKIDLDPDADSAEETEDD